MGMGKVVIELPKNVSMEMPTCPLCGDAPKVTAKIAKKRGYDGDRVEDTALTWKRAGGRQR